MENAIPYSGDLHIDQGTKKLILNLLRSIRSVVPVARPPGPSDPEQKAGMKSPDEIREVLLMARARLEELEGIFNPDELLRYERYASDYQDLIKQMEVILEEMKSCRDSALEFAGGMAEILESHLKLTAAPDYDNQGDMDDFRLKIV